MNRYKELQKALTSTTRAHIEIKVSDFIDAIKLIDLELYKIKISLDSIQSKFDFGRVTISFGKKSPKFLIYQKPYPKKDINGNVIKYLDGKLKLVWSKTYTDSYINLHMKDKFHFKFNGDKIKPLINKADLLLKERKKIVNLFNYNFDNLNKILGS